MDNLKKVTPLSKTLAVLVFLGLLVAVFCWGRIFESAKNQTIVPVSESTVKTDSNQKGWRELSKEFPPSFYVSQKLGVIIQNVPFDYELYKKYRIIEQGSRICFSGTDSCELDDDYIEVYRKDKNESLAQAVTKQLIAGNSARKNCIAISGEKFRGDKNSIFIVDKRLNPNTPEGKGAIDGINAGAAGTFEPGSPAYVYSQMEDFCYPPLPYTFFEDPSDKTYFYYYQSPAQSAPISIMSVARLPFEPLKFVNGFQPN